MFFNAHFVSEKTLVFQSYFNLMALSQTDILTQLMVLSQTDILTQLMALSQTDILTHTHV